MNLNAENRAPTGKPIQGNNGVWTCVLSDPKRIATSDFNPNASWAKPNLGAGLLVHEKYHFKIAEVGAKMLQNSLRNLSVVGTGNTAQAAYQDALNKYINEESTILNNWVSVTQQKQNDYDDDTQHSRNSAEQTRWQGIIDGWVAAKSW